MVQTAQDGIIAKNIIEKIRNMMQLLGSWPLEINLSWKQKLLKYFYISCFITTFVPMFIQIFLDSNMYNISFGISCVTAAFNMVIKYESLFANKSSFAKILENLKDPLFLPNEEHCNNILNKKLRVCERILTIYLCSVLMAGVMVTLGPISYLHSKRRLPMPFPLDMENQPNVVYISLWCIQSIAATGIAWLSAAFDTCLYLFTEIAAAELEILGCRIINMHTKDSRLKLQNTTPNEKNDLIANNLLKDCVIHHGAIERYISFVQQTFARAFFSQLCASLILVCLLGFTWMISPTINIPSIRMFIALGCMVQQVIMFCVPGNDVIHQSEKIRDACYTCLWYNFGPPVRRTLILIMKRTERPFCLTAAGFVILSHETLRSILKSAFSYFTVLWQLYKQSHKI